MEEMMQIVSFVLGLVSVIIMFAAFIPFLGWLNWLNIPLAVLGLIFGVIGVAITKFGRGIGIAGIVLCLIAIIFGALKLQACGGFI
jgi:hypothetical protein